jgi:predicted RNase H-like HicB family nuclease
MNDSEYSAEELEEASHYEIVVTWDNHDKIYIASMPELPGMMVHESTPEAAFNLALHAGADWIAAMRSRGYPVPEPKSMLVTH